MISLLEKIPPPFLSELQKIKNHLSSYTKRVYLVGGCVRDLLMGRELKDFDLEVYDIEPELFDKLMKKLGAKGVGKSFFVYKYKVFDIALARREKKVSKGHRGFLVEVAKDEKEASRRRDFTMNALMINLFSGELLDLWGGVRDIERKLIRIVDKERFKEDSLRVLRAMQFSARLGFKVEKNSCEIMKEIDLLDLTKDRIFWEFEKMFFGKFLHFGLYYLSALEISKKLLNITISKEIFFKTALELAKNRDKFDKRYYQYYFLYILSKNLNISFDKIALMINAPNSYLKILRKQVPLPKEVSDKFLLTLSLDYPIKEWLGNYFDSVKERAVKLGIYEEKFKSKIKAEDLLKEGFRGRELGRELLRRKKMEIERIVNELHT